MLELLPDEKIILLLRRHWLALDLSFFGVFLIGLLPFLVAIFFISWQPTLLPFLSSFFSFETYQPLFWYFSLLFWLLVWCYGVFIWLDWYLDVWILTDQRLIDVDQKGFFDRRILICSLDRVQNVNSKVGGLLPTIFKYGTLEIKTADQTDWLVFKEIPFPNEVQAKMLQAHRDYLENLGRAGQIQSL